jgi:hypothetical protein
MERWLHRSRVREGRARNLVRAHPRFLWHEDAQIPQRSGLARKSVSLLERSGIDPFAALRLEGAFDQHLAFVAGPLAAAGAVDVYPGLGGSVQEVHPSIDVHLHAHGQKSYLGLHPVERIPLALLNPLLEPAIEYLKA